MKFLPIHEMNIITWCTLASHFPANPFFIISVLKSPVNTFNQFVYWCRYFRDIVLYTYLMNMLTAMHSKKKFNKRSASLKQWGIIGLVNNLEQLSHIAIVSFYQGHW